MEMNIQDHYRLSVDRCVDRKCMDGSVYGWMDGWMDKLLGLN